MLGADWRADNAQDGQATRWAKNVPERSQCWRMRSALAIHVTEVHILTERQSNLVKKAWFGAQAEVLKEAETARRAAPLDHAEQGLRLKRGQYSPFFRYRCAKQHPIHSNRKNNTESCPSSKMKELVRGLHQWTLKSNGRLLARADT